MSTTAIPGAESSEPNIVVVDYGMGNLKSVLNALTFLRCRAKITHDPAEIDAADAVVLPGVGAFGEAMENLGSLGLIAPLSRAFFDRKVPFLGICLGMQLIAEESEERGRHKGLGFIPAQVRKIPVPDGYRLPHVGWNDIQIKKVDPFFTGISENSSFYFVHSYRVECDEALVAATTGYGVEVTAAIQTGNLFAAQFHPERSQTNGLKLIRNFTHLVAAAGKVAC